MRASISRTGVAPVSDNALPRTCVLHAGPSSCAAGVCAVELYSDTTQALLATALSHASVLAVNITVPTSTTLSCACRVALDANRL